MHSIRTHDVQCVFVCVYIVSEVVPLCEIACENLFSRRRVFISCLPASLAYVLVPEERARVERTLSVQVVCSVWHGTYDMIVPSKPANVCRLHAMLACRAYHERSSERIPSVLANATCNMRVVYVQCMLNCFLASSILCAIEIICSFL